MRATTLKTSSVSSVPAPVLLKKKRRVKCPLDNLIFTTAERDHPNPCWNVPTTGGYLGGYETGRAMAHDFLKMLRNDQSSTPPTDLAQIVKSFAIKFGIENGPEMCNKPIPERTENFGSLHGQYVGFFNTLSEWLKAGAKHLVGGLDEMTEDDLLARANAGLVFDEEAYLKQLEGGYK